MCSSDHPVCKGRTVTVEATAEKHVLFEPSHDVHAGSFYGGVKAAVK